MKRIYRRITLAFLMFLSFLLVLGGGATLALSAHADEPDTPAPAVQVYGGESTWYTLTYDSSAHQLTLLLDAGLSDYFDISTADIEELGNGLTEAMRDIIADGVLSPDADEPATVAEIPDLDSIDLGNLDEYIEKYLYDQDNIKAYLKGEYDFLFQYAVERYLAENPDGTYDEVADKINELLEQAIDAVFEEGEREAVKDEAKAYTLYLVDEVKQNGGTVTLSVVDIIEILDRIVVNDHEIFRLVEERPKFSMSEIRALLGELPRPSVLAGYTDEQMKSLIDYDIAVETGYGAFSFGFTAGLDGNCSRVRTAARLLADHVDFAYREGVYDVSVSLPELFSNAFLSLTESDLLSDQTKQALFGLFGKTADDLSDMVDRYTFDKFVTDLKSIDYQVWFENFLSAEWLNGFFGEITDANGDHLKDEDIDNFLNRLFEEIVPTLKKLQNLSVEKVQNLLRKYVSSDKLDSAVEKFISFIKKADWDKLSADYLRGFVARENFNEEIYSYLDRLESFEGVYDTFIGYAEKLLGRIPEDTKGTLADTYTGMGNFNLSFEDDFTLKGLLDSVLGQFTSDSDLAEITNVLLPYFDTTQYSVSVDFSLFFPHVYRVTYLMGEEERVGFLPVGADVSFFANRTDLEGFEILYWYDVMAETEGPLAGMPAYDLYTRPVTAFTLTDLVDGAEANEVSAVYDPDAEYVLSVDVAGVSFADYTYQWYRDGEALDGMTSAQLTVAHADDSAVYTVAVTDTLTAHTVESEAFRVAIDPIHVTVTAELVSAEEGVSLDEFVYTGADRQVAWNTVFASDNSSRGSEFLADFFTVTESGTLAATPAGEYTANLAVAFSGETASDFAFDGFTTEEVWHIAKAVVTVTVGEWTGDLDTVYTGEVKTVALGYTVAVSNGLELPEGVLEVTYEGNSAEDAGSYTATAEFSLTDTDNYALADVEVPALEWNIAKATILFDSAVNAAFTETEYTGAEITNEVSVVPPYDVEKLEQSVEGNVGTDAGSYEISFKIRVREAYQNNYELEVEALLGGTLADGVWEYTIGWEITPKTVHVPTVTWSETDLEVTFDGEDHIGGITYTLAGDDKDLFDATLTVTDKDGATVSEAIAVGEYTFRVTFALKAALNEENYVVEGAAESEAATLVIREEGHEEHTYNLSGARWVVNGEPISPSTDGDTPSYTLPYTFEEIEVTLRLPDGAAYTLDDLNVSVDPAGVIKNVGTYTLTVSAVDQSYTIIGFDTTLTLTVEQYVYDLSGVAAEHTEFTYDGQEHTVTLTGLPASGVKVAHEGTLSETQVGTYHVTFTFSVEDAVNTKIDAASATLTVDWEIKDPSAPAGDKLYDKDGVLIFDQDGNFAANNPNAQAEAAGVTDITAHDAAIRSAIGSGKDYTFGAAWDIHFNEGGQEKNVQGKFLVYLPIPENLRSGNRNLAVIHIADDGTVTLVDAERGTGEYINHMIFEANSFSVYAVIEIKDAVAPAPEEENDIFTQWWFWLIIAVVAVLIIVMIILIVLRVKKGKGGDDEGTDGKDGGKGSGGADGSDGTFSDGSDGSAGALGTVGGADGSAVALTAGGAYAAAENPMLDRSFTARLSQADDASKANYSALKNELLSYVGVRSSTNWEDDTFTKSGNICAKMRVEGTTLNLLLALKLADLDAEKYHLTDASRECAEAPVKMAVADDQALAGAKELIAQLMSDLGATKVEAQDITYAPPKKTTEELVRLGLIRTRKTNK